MNNPTDKELIVRKWDHMNITIEDIQWLLCFYYKENWPLNIINAMFQRGINRWISRTK